MRLRFAGCLVGALLAAAPPPLSAQDAADAGGPGLRQHFGGGGEIAAVLAPHDATAFFNYSDYRRDVVRLARLRLFGEWRPAERWSVIAELRTENADDVMLPALYVRWQPSARRDAFIHAGRIPPVIGGFARHAYGRDNIVIGQPLAYQYLTSLRPDALPATMDDLLRMRGRGWQPSFPVGSTSLAPGIPLISVSTWDTGVSGLWRPGILDLAGALTRGSPSIPVVGDTNDGMTWSGRIAARLPRGVTVGVSGARGQWLEADVLDLTAAGRSGRSAQTVVGTDVELGHGPWLVRGEWLRSTFDMPDPLTPTSEVRLDAWSGFVEARYRPLPRWQVGMRLERLAFGSVPDGTSTGTRTWDADVDRVEAVVGFRATRHVEIRGGWQHNWRDGGRVRVRGLPVLALYGWF
jgi:hypothetical protein